jgi:prepilin-type N-terminal cleavage/methylation domain-containing protein
MKTKSFTLIELLIVITIIGILAVALVPRITQGPARARDVKRKADLQNISTALELYYSDHVIYPGPEDESIIPAQDCAGGDEDLDENLSPYMQGNKVPKDSVGALSINCDASYYYRVMPTTFNGTTRSAFMLVANLENDSALGEGIYCDLDEVDPSAWTDSETTVSDLEANWICDENDDTRNAFYVILR